MRDGRPSITATWVAAWRAIGGGSARAVVRDDVAEHLVPAPYASILRVARDNPQATRQLNRFVDVVSGGRTRHLALRTRAIDDGVTAAIERGAEQLVLVGAGLDARAFRLPALREVTVFEVDHPSTQGWKKQRVGALTPLARELRFVATDFERDSLRERLAAAGHDATRPTVFIWEGVSMYLTSPAIDRLLHGLRECAAPESTLLATYFEPQPSKLAGALSVVLRGISEPVRSRFSAAEFETRLSPHAFEVELDEGDPEWSRRYLAVHQPWSLERLVTARRR